MKLLDIKPLRKGTIQREKLKAELERIKADPASKPAYFLCRNCGKSHPIAEIGRRYAHGPADCKACTVLATAKITGTYRAKNNATIDSIRRGRRKSNDKRYASWKLPKWMLS